MRTRIVKDEPERVADAEPPGEAAEVVGRDLIRRYGGGDAAVDALRGVSLSVAAGELVAVMGPSGSGRSTLMHILAGLDQPTGGEVWIGETEVTGLGDTALTRLRRDHIGFIFRFSNLLPMLSAEENVALPMAIAGRTPDRACLEELIRAVGLAERRSHRPAEPSGGQQQRVAIARAMLSRPTVMFADEPTGTLDSRASGEIQDLLRRAVEDYGQTTVMVAHDAGAATIADRILFLADGRIVTERGALLPGRGPRGARGGDPMRRVALRGLAARKLRAVLTAIAIVLGVAMVSGTFILTDTIDRASPGSSPRATGTPTRW